MDQLHSNPYISLVVASFYLNEHLNDQDEQQQLLHQAKNANKNAKIFIKIKI